MSMVSEVKLYRDPKVERAHPLGARADVEEHTSNIGVYEDVISLRVRVSLRRVKRSAQVASIVDTDKENEPPAKRQRKQPSDAERSLKQSKTSPKKKGGKKASKLFNEVEPNQKVSKIEKGDRGVEIRSS